MKIPTFKISRREKGYLIAGGAALLVGVVIFPAVKAASTFRTEQLDGLQNEIALLEDLNGLMADARAIQQENELLRDALKDADELLFPPIDNHIMMQTRMIKRLNDMGPDLDLEVAAGRSSIGDSSTQMNLSVRGRGRYPEILKFLHRVETYRPLILVDSMSLAAPMSKKKSFSKSKNPSPEKTKDPTMGFKISIQIHTRAGEEGGA
jgi:hypothetical protein